MNPKWQRWAGFQFCFRKRSAGALMDKGGVGTYSACLVEKMLISLCHLSVCTRFLSSSSQGTSPSAFSFLVGPRKPLPSPLPRLRWKPSLKRQFPHLQFDFILFSNLGDWVTSHWLNVPTCLPLTRASKIRLLAFDSLPLFTSAVWGLAPNQSQTASRWGVPGV